MTTLQKKRLLFDFNTAFFELKLTGFVQRKVRKRIDRYGEIVEMPLYNFANPGRKRSISDPDIKKNLFQYYTQVRSWIPGWGILVSRKQFDETMQLLLDNHISSVEVVRSLSTADDEDLITMPVAIRERVGQEIRFLQSALAKQQAHADAT